MKDRFDLLVFDWDGTLFDSIAWIVHCLQSAAEDCGLPRPGDSAARSVIGLGLREAMDHLFPAAPEGKAQILSQHYKRHFLAKPTTPEDLFDGVPELLDSLRDQGYRLAVATGKTRAGLDAALAATGLEDRFQITRCADETASKPDPKMLREIFAALGTSPERSVMIGDSVHDMRMAQNAGVAAIAVTCGANERHELQAFQPLACLSSTAELLNLLQ